MLTLEKISSLEVFLAFKDEWDGLLSRCPQQTPFLTHDWMLIWWRYFGQGKELCILVLREQGEVMAIAPLMRYRGWWYERYLKLPVRLIEGMANYHSNRFDLIFADYRDGYFALLWRHLLEEEWEILRLYPLLTDSPTLEGLRNIIEHECLRSAFTKVQNSPYLLIPSDLKNYLKTLSGEVGRKARRADRLAAEGKLTVEFFTTGPDLDAVLAQIFEVSEKGWAAREGTAISSTPQLRGFYSELARMTSTKGWLFISLLKAGNKPIAYEYSLAYRGTVYHLKTAFDPEFSHYDPGYSLKHFTLTEIIEHMPSIQEYDFLGDAESYKLKWTPHVRPHVKVHIYRPRSGYPRLLHFIQSKLIVPIKDRRLESH